MGEPFDFPDVMDEAFNFPDMTTMGKEVAKVMETPFMNHVCNTSPLDDFDVNKPDTYGRKILGICEIVGIRFTD